MVHLFIKFMHVYMFIIKKIVKVKGPVARDFLMSVLLLTCFSWHLDFDAKSIFRLCFVFAKIYIYDNGHASAVLVRGTYCITVLSPIAIKYCKANCRLILSRHYFLENPLGLVFTLTLLTSAYGIILLLHHDHSKNVYSSQYFSL
jgi:hypothetical protein